MQDIELGAHDVDTPKVRREMERRSKSSELPQLFLRGRFLGAGRDALQNLVYLNDTGAL